MEDLIEFLMGNIVVVAIIVMGIIRVLTGANKSQQNKQQPTRQQNTTQPARQAPVPSPSEGQHKPKQTVYQSSGEKVYVEKEQIEEEPRSTVYTTSTTNIYMEEQNQMEQLKNRMNISEDVSLAEINQMDISLGTEIQDEIKHSASSSGNKNKMQFKRDVKSGLNREGLINGIIMSEVLGSPRARKPYRSVVSERKKQSS